GPVLPPSIPATPPWWAMPGLGSRPRARRRSATRSAVLRSRFPSSGFWWTWWRISIASGAKRRPATSPRPSREGAPAPATRAAGSETPVIRTTNAREFFIDPPTLSFIDPPSYPPPRRGEGSPMHVRLRVSIHLTLYLAVAE